MGKTETPMRIIVTGSRHLYPREDAEKILARIVTDRWPEDIRIIHGCCPVMRSVDWAFDEAAINLGLEVEQIHPEQYGPWPGCGPKRNSAMVDLGADLCITYHEDIAQSKGTLDCVRKCILAKIPVDLYVPQGIAQRIESFAEIPTLRTP
jgi:hypothetical protein